LHACRSTLEDPPMEEKKNYKIIKPLKKEITDDILFRNKALEEINYRKQLMNEIRERIRLSIEANDPAFIKTLKALLGSTENENSSM
jgi:hypothetical protein